MQRTFMRQHYRTTSNHGLLFSILSRLIVAGDHCVDSEGGGKGGTCPPQYWTETYTIKLGCCQVPELKNRTCIFFDIRTQTVQRIDATACDVRCGRCCVAVTWWIVQKQTSRLLAKLCSLHECSKDRWLVVARYHVAYVAESRVNVSANTHHSHCCRRSTSTSSNTAPLVVPGASPEDKLDIRRHVYDELWLIYRNASLNISRWRLAVRHDGCAARTPAVFRCALRAGRSSRRTASDAAGDD